MPIYCVDDNLPFPTADNASSDGLLAYGGDLSAERLMDAYYNGIFPWFDEGSEDIMWWSPDPRMILYPSNFKLSKTLKQKIRRKTFEIRIDTAFEDVIKACRKVPREDQDGTWITQDIIDAYVELHKLGIAHSVECWQDDKLVGGLYGLSLGKAFFGESMFHHVSDASKVAFYALKELAVALDFHFIDCQMHTDHLESLGAIEIPRDTFLSQLEESNKSKTRQGNWSELVSMINKSSSTI